MEKLEEERQMRFGFDIDDTLLNIREHAFHIYNKKLNKQVPLDEFYKIKRLEIHEPFGMDDDQGNKMWNDTEEEIYFSNVRPFPGAVELLQQLEKDGHEIYYITARRKKHGEQTKKWLKQRGFPVRDDRFFWGMKDEEKIEFIKKLNLDVYVDDSPHVLTTLVHEPIHVFIKDQPYNREFQLPRFADWAEFRQMIENLKMADFR